jgi:hypothetical protein
MAQLIELNISCLSYIYLRNYTPPNLGASIFGRLKFEQTTKINHLTGNAVFSASYQPALPMHLIEQGAFQTPVS